MAKPTVAGGMMADEVFAWFAYAQAPAATGTGPSTTTSTTTSATGTTGATTTTTTKMSKHKKAPAAKKFHGYVNGVDATAKSFNVSATTTSTDVVTYKTNDKTKYSPKGKTFDDLKAGDKVSGTFKNDGTDNWAITVHIAAVGGGNGPTCPDTGTCPCKKKPGVCSDACCDD